MGNGKKNILIVDDSRTVRQLLKMVLSRNIDSALTEAEDGQEAYEMLKKNRFDLIITDINMPRMCGLSLVNRVRSEMESDTPIIIVTTMGHEGDRDVGLKMGANTYITKPINGNSLIEAVKGLI